MTARRIALVTESFQPDVDGTTTTLRKVADHLVDTGREVLVVAPGPGQTSYRSMRVARVVPGRRGSQVRAALADFAPDLVHVASPGALGRRALHHAERLRVPTVVVQHAAVTAGGPGLHASRVLVTAPWMAARMATLGVRATVWEPGVDTAAFTPALRDGWLHGKWARARSADGPHVVVGYAGSLHKRHGVRRLAELTGLPGTRLVVIGDGPQRGWLEAHLPGARFTGALATGQLAIALASLDVLVHPGTAETCCHVHREAAASGIPVVAPRAGGVVGLVRPLETGMTYDADDPHALRRAVAAVAADRHRHQLGARARELASGRTWADACAELDAVHAQVVSGAGSALRHLGAVG